MKTLLLIAGLLFNISLCCYSADEPLLKNTPADKTAPAQDNIKAERKPLAYSAMLKGKASNLPRQ